MRALQQEKLKYLVLVFPILATISQVNFVRELNNQVSLGADPFSEANTIRAGEFFADKGFTKYWGLADLIYGDRFPEHGTTAMHPPEKEYIYTHYPPGPEWLTGVMTIIFGKGNYTAYRLIPILASVVGLGALLLSVASSFGVIVGLLLGALLYFTPATTNMMHALHYQGYSVGLLCLQLAHLLHVAFVRKGTFRQGDIAGLFLGGFLQGWLSFDFFFIIALLPLPILAWKPPKWTSDTKPLIKTMPFLAPMVGFGTAHAVHFLQVIAFYGSFSEAFTDLFMSAKWRAMGELPWDGSRVTAIGTLARYVREWGPNGTFFGKSWYLALLSCLLVMLYELLLPLIRRQRLAPRRTVACLLAFVASSLWILVMKQHAAIHVIFIPRHFYLFHVVAVIAALSLLPVHGKRTEKLSA